jgi:translation initiation factor IF-2
LRITEYITVQEFAHQLDVKATEIIAKLMGMGAMATINQRLDRSMIEFLAESYEIEIEWLDEYEEDALTEEEELQGESLPRMPVVTVMGHVDHGKTSLLDYIRKTNVIAGEAGGITQHIGAYQVETSKGKITFLDTPGHEAFSAMRARGAQVTDIVVIVVAADDKVMPQTVEAIDHARASNCPIVIAINKIDLPAADPLGVKQQLTHHNVLVEEFGGEIQCVEISAKKGTNVDQLLEAIGLQAEVMELSAVQDGRARGVVVESQKDPGRGVSFTVLVSQGSLHKGDAFVAGLTDGRVRALRNEYNEDVEQAIPGEPVVVLGANGVPLAGDSFTAYEDERQAREVASKRQQVQREQSLHELHRGTTLENIFEKIQGGEAQELNLLVKGDVAGSVEALCDSLMNLSTEKVAVRVIHKAVGGITESDVNLAAASDAIIVGFHLHPPAAVRDAAKRQNVPLHTYNVIYEAVDEVRQAMSGLLKPVEREVASGSAEVRETFKVPRIGLIAGCMVVDGTIKRNSRVKVIRDQVQIYEGVISSLRRFKDDAREVQSGFECGIGVEGYQDVRVGDTLQTYEIEEVEQEL